MMCIVFFLAGVCFALGVVRLIAMLTDDERYL